MADSRHITRRAALVGALSAPVAVAFPLAAEASPPFDLRAHLADLPAKTRVNLLQSLLAEALCEISPGHWRTASTLNNDFLILVRDAQTSHGEASIYVQYVL